MSEEIFINRVKKIILDNYQDENFDIKKIASEIGLSRSQLLRKVKASTGKSINKLIKELRLIEAVKLIENGEYTCAQIAYKVGFSSPQYFSKCFHDFYGYTPGEYKKNKLQDSSTNDLIKDTYKSKYSYILKYILSSLITFVLLFLSYQLIIKKVVRNKSIKMHSVAVLPFTDLSKENDTEWFCDGVTDEIISNLSKISGLRVISKTSTKQFKNSNRSIPEIAKVLGVNYIVEGSVRKHENAILITAQLIKATDEHIWTEKYNEKLDDIFKIQNSVSKKIVQQLKIVLSPSEEKLLNEKPTNNFEAYQLFLKGRFIADNRTKEDLEKSIKLYKRAIVLDPRYADAYAEIAHSYLLLSGYGYMNTSEARNKINTFTNKALKIKPNTVRVYSTLGSLFCRDGNYEKSKENFEKALILNPNDATTRYLFADYFKNSPKFDAQNWLIQISLAQQIDPSSIPINNDLVWALLQNGKIQEADNHYNKMKILFKPIAQLKLFSALSSLKNKDRTETIRIFEKAVENDPTNADLRLNLAICYKTIMHDYEKMLFHMKLVYDTNPQKLAYSYRYFYALLYTSNFDTANELLNNSGFMGIFSEELKAWLKLDYHYYKSDFDKAFEYLDKLKSKKSYYYNKASIYAQKGAVHSAYQTLKHVPYLQNRAVIFALLKERDSMYYYLNKVTSYQLIEFLNGVPEFDPYRKDPEYKSFLKKNYFPVINN